MDPRRPAPAMLATTLLLLALPAPPAAAQDEVPTRTPAPAAARKPPVKADDDDKPWKVEELHGPYDTIAFTASEGTWLSIDVHPDGRRIVFSLLGDLYLLPIEGGTATRLTGGTAYDVQPRFSPDGTRIAFASDRGGVENLWTIGVDGKEPRRVSDEKATTVNSPAWSPDGAYLVGRKRITDVSSLGRVELWLWHVQGGGGVRLTKADDQPDAADPTFSPDGRFVYYSARESRYRYNRNVYEGIWQVKRLDRRTGQAIEVTGEVGGAAAPLLSPDGRTLAFVRRMSARTRIELLDLATGRVRTLADGVERDGQEGFAFHGVFPGYAWTPDGRAIVATAEGRLWRFDLAGGERAPIPFTAAVEQRVTRALRYPHALGGDQVRAKVLRWPVVSPDGRWLVFSALGRLHGVALPAGEPRRLSGSSDLEFAPTFSPSGDRIAFVTWSDREGGHIWVAPFGAEGMGRPVRISASPGQYANPSFSPDGKRLVYLKGTGAALRGHDLADELWLEVHWIGTDGSPGGYIIGTRNRGAARRMPRPTFAPDGERIYLVEDEPAEKPAQPPKTLLVSVKLDGTDRRAHLRFTRAEEAMVSPDGRWVAFSELHDAWVTALPEAGAQPVDLDLEKPPLPLGPLTEEGGEWISWAAGGRIVAWSAGPRFHRLAVEKAFPPPDPDPPAKKDAGKSGAEKAQEQAKEARKKRKLPQPEMVEVKLEVPRARPQETVLYRGARLVTMRGDEVIEHGAILVEGDRIAAVGADDAVAAPAGAREVDLAGKTIVPGFIDVHAHLHYSVLDVFPEQPWKYLANLAYGITTTHDPSAGTHEVFGQAEMVEAGMMIGPRIFSTGYILYGADDPQRAVIDSLADARHHVRRLKALGAFSVKSYMQPRREQRQWIITAARDEGMLVVPEGGGDLEMDMTMVLDGHTTIEHALPIAPLRQDVVGLLAASETSYNPTLLVAYGGLSGEHWFYQHYDVWRDERLLRFVPREVIDRRARIRSVMAADEDWHHLDVAASAAEVARKGGRICLGSHGQLQGLGAHWELWAFVQAGMTPHEALRVATRMPAETLGLDRDLGTLEAGKLADFIVLERNPLEKIENTDSAALVVKNGVAYDPEQLRRKPLPN